MRLRLKLYLTNAQHFTRVYTQQNAYWSSLVYIRYVHGDGGTALSIISRYYDCSSVVKFISVLVAGKRIDGIWYRVATRRSL